AQRRIVIVGRGIVQVHAGDEIKVSGTVVNGGRSSPQAAAGAIGRVVENGRLQQRRLIVGQNPAVIAMSEADVNGIGRHVERQSIALVTIVLQGNYAVIVIPSVAIDGACYHHGTAKPLVPGSDIERVQAKHLMAVFNTVGHNVHHARGAVDHRR